MKWLEILFAGLAALAAVAALFFSCQSNRKADEVNGIATEANKIAKEALNAAEFAPFHPIAVISDPIWKVEEVYKPDSKVMLALVSTITISNKGAQAGCIGDLVAVLQIPATEDKRRLRANYFVNSEKLLETLRQNKKGKGPIYEAHEAPFAPIVVLGKQQISRTVVFRHPRFNRDDIREGKYVLSLIGCDCEKQPTWTQYWKSSYQVARKQADELVCGQVTIFESEERINAVRSLRIP